jgi:hypothetical protein
MKINNIMVYCIDEQAHTVQGVRIDHRADGFVLRAKPRGPQSLQTRIQARASAAIPPAIDPPSWGAGRRPARHVKRTLTARTDAGGSGGGLLGLPGSMAGGMAYRNHPRTPPADVVPAILEPERPRRRRSNRDPATVASSPTRPACAPLRRAVLAARPGRLPAHHLTGQRSVVLRRPSGLPAIRASRRAQACRPQSASGSGRRAQAAARAARQGSP